MTTATYKGKNYDGTHGIVEINDGSQSFTVNVTPANKNDLDGSKQPRRDPESIDPVVIAAHDANILAYEQTVDLESFEEATARWVMDIYNVTLSPPPPTFEQLVAQAVSFADLKALVLAQGSGA